MQLTEKAAKTPSPSPRLPRSKPPKLRLTAIAWLAPLLLATSAPAQPAPATAPPNPDDILGTIEVVAGGKVASLPKIAVLPSLASAIEDVTLRSVVRRDLDLCGEFEVLSDSQAPQGLYLADTPVDVKAWSGKGVEALVRVSAKVLGADRVELRGQAYFLKSGAAPVFDKKFEVAQKDVRVESHRVADLLIGALTGTNGAFASHMTFASGMGKLRRVFTIDADGNDAKAMSTEGHIAIAPAFAKDGTLHYAASINHDEYKIFTPKSGPLPTSVKGSVYGIAFSDDGTKVAASVAAGSSIFVFSGPDFEHLTQASPTGMALHPTFSPNGLLAFSGEGKYGQQIYVDGKAISPSGLFASAPTFCQHPNGIRAVFAVGVGKNTDLVSTGERGGQMLRLTQNQGRNGYPACSPDGRLIAFFSTRNSNEGPGLYIMRIDGGRPKRISTLLGDSLRWNALPPSDAVKVAEAP